ncbi:ABC transporter permease [Egicoccus halophilus]|uniref:Molybdenum transport system permease n=1 Tax=Egicoccus halophilus TaxID=1670830 RepID=A0A8J3EWD0_9ACTN|nr:ABC transporter permease [Egicoccus halophilus]GGI03385.1 molybdate ABC transporter permease [Egicoccus halophilus]
MSHVERPADADTDTERPVVEPFHGRRADRVLAVLVALALVAGLALFLLPLLGLLLRTPWSGLGPLLSEPRVLQALRLSVVTSLASLALSVVLGVPLAWLLARTDFPGKRLLRALCVLPMVLPPVVGGVALLTAFGRRGVVGAPLERWTGVSLPFTTLGVVLAVTFVAMPFLVVTVEAGFRAVDGRLEDAAATLGASRLTVFRRVTLPLLAPSLLAGMALAWARALGEFGASITFAGNLPGRTQTVPLAVYLELERDADTAIALSMVLLGVSVAVLVLLRDRYLGGGGRA